MKRKEKNKKIITQTQVIYIESLKNGMEIIIFIPYIVIYKLKDNHKTEITALLVILFNHRYHTQNRWWIINKNNTKNTLLHRMNQLFRFQCASTVFWLIILTIITWILKIECVMTTIYFCRFLLQKVINITSIMIFHNETRFQSLFKMFILISFVVFEMNSENWYAFQDSINRLTKNNKIKWINQLEVDVRLLKRMKIMKIKVIIESEWNHK